MKWSETDGDGLSDNHITIVISTTSNIEIMTRTVTCLMITTGGAPHWNDITLQTSVAAVNLAIYTFLVHLMDALKNSILSGRRDVVGPGTLAITI